MSLFFFLNGRLYRCDTVDPFLFTISYDILCINLLHFNNTIKTVYLSDLLSLLDFKVTKIHSSVHFYVPLCLSSYMQYEPIIRLML